MKLLIVLAALVVVAFACHSDHECGHLTNCQSHQRPQCHDGRCICNGINNFSDHHIGKRQPGTCTDDDFSNCSCEHGGTPACKHGHCHCNHHVFRQPGTCTDDDFSNCTCEHGGTPACKHGHCHCNHH
ncbi:hypothetical protein LOTGIDRAFT_163834 [Lottia gigantea]|uniref:Uncharacterized protein n=1 Tax=Lottia gigantea TaxID=225164 RepID=V4BNY6_LOTGI|nr:hypothetical protein LOTGIDRAFT_163834 [Lottia gigantea]ESO90634.1 hypothetical protein LOTGIDRAFT_163834 [Lottia gigantea]